MIRRRWITPYLYHIYFYKHFIISSIIDELNEIYLLFRSYKINAILPQRIELILPLNLNLIWNFSAFVNFIDPDPISLCSTSGTMATGFL